MPKPKTGDFIVAAVVLLTTAALAVLLYGATGSNGTRTAVLVCADAEPVRISLDALNSGVELDAFGDGTVLLHADSDGISFTHSNCPDKTCVRTGVVSRTGQTAACLPRRVVVYIESGAADGVDTVVS